MKTIVETTKTIIYNTGKIIENSNNVKSVVDLKNASCLGHSQSDQNNMFDDNLTHLSADQTESKFFVLC